MYLQYWHLKEKPFENTPDPKFLFHSAQHEEALSRLLYMVREGKGAGVLTGIYGCGKTLLGHTLHRELQKDIYRVAFLTNPRLDEIEMLRMIVHLLSGGNVSSKKADILMAMEEILNSNLREGKKTVIVIDEAHSIEESSIFEELRLLLNFQTENQFLLTLLLFGQPELKNKIEANKQLHQRIAMRYYLKGLTPDETANYIYHRLIVAGTKTEIFVESALALIHERSAGIPRKINQICDLSLLTGMVRKKEKIETEIVTEAIESIEGE